MHLREFVAPIANKLGRDIEKRMRTRVRLGYGVSGHGAAKEKFRKLKPSTIAGRERLKAEGKLSPLETPKKATMTRFGDMMDALTHTASTTSVTILFSKREEAEKAFWQQDPRKLNRPFMYLTDVEMQVVNDYLQEAMDDYVDSIAKSV